MPEPYRLWYNKASMDPNQQGQSNAGAPSASSSGASTPSVGTPAAGTPPPVFSGAGAQVPGASVTPGPTAPATPTATPAGSSARRFFGASNRPGSAASAGQPASSIYSGNPTPGIITSAPAASGAAGGKKLSKGMIVGLIVIAILAIAAVVVGVIAATGGNRSSESESSQSAPVNMSELKTAYNNLANYIAFGDENKSEGKYDGKTYSTEEMLNESIKGFRADPILEADKYLEEGNSAQKGKYFQKLNELCQQLPNEKLYNEYNIDSQSICDYYNNFSSIGMVSPSDIVSRYEVEGLESTRNYIQNTVTTSIDIDAIEQYTNYLRDFNLAYLDLINDVKINLGCDVNLDNSNKCDFSSSGLYEAYNTALANLMTGNGYQIKTDYQRAAVRSLFAIANLVDDKTSKGTQNE